MKEELPSILVTDGWESDANDKLVEAVIPSSVKTLQAPSKITFMGQTLNYIPSTTTALQKFEAPNCTSALTDVFKGYTELVRADMNAITSLSEGQASGTGAFYGCKKLTTVNLNSLNTLSLSVSYASSGTFYGCTNLTTVSLNALESIDYRTGGGSAAYWASPFGYCSNLVSITLPSLKTTTCQRTMSFGGGSVFLNCTALETVNFPSFEKDTSNTSCFRNCSNLQTVTLGSKGHPVQSISQYMFDTCTQSNLTITVYTTGGASLANAPWGATNSSYSFVEA